MRSLYESVNKSVRIANFKQAAQECSLAGFDEFAAINGEMASILAKDEERARREREETNAERQERKPFNGIRGLNHPPSGALFGEGW